MDNNDNPIIVEMVGIKDEREELLIKLWWNEAIEAAAKMLDETCGVAGDDIRELKKK